MFKQLDLEFKNQNDKLEEKQNEVSWKISFGIGCILGAVIFILIYGVKILDVTYDDWLVGHGDDLTMHLFRMAFI